MKKTILVASLTVIAMLGITSCKKEKMEKDAIAQTYTIALKANEVYTFTLPTNTRNDAYQFTTNATHASVSQIGKDADGNSIYTYTPALDYVGTDEVVLSNDQERAEHGNHPSKPKPALGVHPQGDCNGGGEEDHYIVTIHFVVDAATANRKK
jgi:hypothetical protein